MGAVEELLDESIVPTKAGYVIREPAEGSVTYVDLSQIDFEALKRQFRKAASTSRPKSCAAASTASCANGAPQRTRMDYYQRVPGADRRIQRRALKRRRLFRRTDYLAQNLNQEEQRSIAENLSEEELALFDLLTKPNVD